MNTTEEHTFRGASKRRGVKNPITGVAINPPLPPPVVEETIEVGGASYALHVQRTFAPDVLVVVTPKTSGTRIRRGAVLVRVDAGWTLYNDGLYSALRGMEHAARYYADKETRVALSIGSLTWALAMAWDLDLVREGAPALDAYRAKLDEAVAFVGKYKDPRLADAARRAEWAKEIVDACDPGRWNPMSRAAILCAAIRRSKAWIDVRNFLTAKVDMRRLALAQVAAQAFVVRDEVLLELEEIHGHWWDSHRIHRLNRSCGKKLAVRLKVAAANLETVRAAPFVHAFSRTKDHLLEAASILHPASPQEPWAEAARRAGEKLAIARRALALLEVQRIVEETLTTLALAARRGLRLDDEDEILAAAQALALARDALVAITDDGFQKPILESVRPPLEEAIHLLVTPADPAPGPVADALRKAVKPF